MASSKVEDLLLDSAMSFSDRKKALLNLKKDDLKDSVRRRQLPLSGTKQDLVKRLIEGQENGGDPASTNNHLQSTKRVRQRTISENMRKQLREEREGIVLWKKPLYTIYYGLSELVITITQWFVKLLERKWSLLFMFVMFGAAFMARRIEGPHRAVIDEWESYFLWCSWWVGLGVLSSVGLGTGLHTFLLYLGPHIASVTLAAYECGTTDFPSPPYPDSIVCPDDQESGTSTMTILKIMSKVRVEAFCWGFGTALGELPPYFMAKAHRLSGYDPDDDDDQEEKELFELQQKNPEDLSFMDRAKLKVEKVVENLGFFGILACASIPNPLFDLAGITCGHFLVPFWTFFGATVIGKAIVKMNIQKMFVILAFNEKLIEYVVSHLHNIPVIGAKLEQPFKQALALQKEKLHRKSGATDSEQSPLLAMIFEKLVLLMVAYFLVSILNSLAQAYHKRIHKKKDGVKTQ